MYRQTDTTDSALGFRYFMHRTGRARPQGAIDSELAQTPMPGVPAQFGLSARSMFALPDFSAGFVEAMAEVIGDAIAAWPHRELCHAVAVSNFKEIDAPHLAIDLGLATVPENGHYGAPVSLTLSESLVTAGVETRGSLLRITRQLEMSDSIRLLNSAVLEISRSVALDEQRSFAAMLESTAALADGLPFMSATAGNLITSGAAPSLPTVNAAVAYLAGASGALPAYLIVPPALWTTALTIAAALTSTSGEPPIRVVSLPALTSSTAWYVLADPLVAPAAGLVHLGEPGDPIETFRLERVPTPPTLDGTTYRVSNVIKFLPLSRGSIFSNDGA